MDPVDALHRLGGIATYSTLARACERAEIEKRLLAGVICRDGRGRYSLPTTDQARRSAHAVTGVVSHLSAALHWGWAVKAVPSLPHVTVPRNRNLSASGKLIPHWSTLRPDEVVDFVTTRDRTLADCLRHLPLDEALAVADSALRAGDTTPTALARIAAEVRGPGASRARRTAALADGAAANPFESVLRAIAIGVTGLEVKPQVRISDGRFFARPDLVDEALGVVLEADSNTWHNSSRSQLRRDCRRYTGLVARGWLVGRFVWEDVMFDASYVEKEIVLLLAGARQRAQSPSRRRQTPPG